MAWARRNGPYLGLGIALAAAAALLITLTWDYTFFQDTWAVLLDRQDFSVDSFLQPHNEHLVVFQVAVEKLFVEIFGMTTARPEMLFLIAALLTAGALMFVYVRRRVGPWPALFAAILLLFLGSGWPVLLWPFEIEFAAPIAAGIGMLLLLEREDRIGDLWACLLLIVGIGFGSLGISFAAAALVDVFLKRRTRGWGRLWVAAVPLLLYGAWYLGWGHEAERHMTFENVLNSPHYVFDGFATAVGSLAGLSTTPVTSPGEPEWGRPLLIALIALAVYGQWRRPGVSPTFWPLAAAALSYWALAAFNFIPGREAASTRYVYAGAAFVLLLAAELLRGVRFSPRALWIGAALTLVAVLPNLAQLKDGADWLEEQSVLTRADTGALEISRRTVPPSFGLGPELAGTSSLFIVTAGKYFEAVDEHGSPAYSPEELAEAPEGGRRWADVVLSQALPLSTEIEPGGFDPEGGAGSCTTVSPAVPAPAEGIALPAGATRIEVAPGPDANFKLRRFAAAEFPVPTEAVPGESTALLRIPRDRAPARQWHLQVEAQQPVRICPPAGG
jgi:hypothetical protein